MMMFKINYFQIIKNLDKNFHKNKKYKTNQIIPINPSIKLPLKSVAHFQIEISPLKNNSKTQTVKIQHQCPISQPNNP
jgi:hypothetical protein